MAHFARLNNENIVEDIVVVNNNVLLDENGVEKEKLGIDFCRFLYNYDNFKQTSYNGNFRKNYANIGYTYDEARDAFIPPNRIKGWVLNEETCLWEAPVPMPSDGKDYTWNQESLEWELIDL